MRVLPGIRTDPFRRSCVRTSFFKPGPVPAGTAIRAAPWRTGRFGQAVIRCPVRCEAVLAFAGAGRGSVSHGFIATHVVASFRVRREAFLLLQHHEPVGSTTFTHMFLHDMIALLSGFGGKYGFVWQSGAKAYA